MDIKNEAISILASAIVSGYGQASIEAATKTLVAVIAWNNKLSDTSRKQLEDDLRWIIKEKLEELNKEKTNE